MISGKNALFLIFTGLLAMTACSGGKEPGTTEPQVTKPGSIHLTASQIKNGGIGFGVVTKQMLSLDINAKGKLVLSPQNLAYVSSLIPGTVEKILVREGDHVNKGAPVAELISPDFIRLQQEYLAALGHFKAIELDFQRQQTLAREQIASDKKLQEITAMFDDARSKLSALRVQLEMLNIPTEEEAKGNFRKSLQILSPIAGHVDELMINPGQYIGPETRMMIVVDKNRMVIELMVFEKDVRYVSVGQRVTFILSNMGGEKYEARVQSIGKTVEENARTVEVLAEFMNNSPGILPGMFVAAEIHTDEQLVDALPEEAVATVENQAFCYYTTSDENAPEMEFFSFPVKTGFHEDGFVQVELLKEIPPQAKIVVKGTYFVKAAGQKQEE